jgi:leader peptidase (prepilin peptidase)/N-methyltransferase
LKGAPTDWDWASLGVLNLRNAAIGALVGAGLFSAIAILGRIAFRRDAMGHGDIKLVRGMGALLLTPGMLVAFGVSIATGAVLGGLWAYWRSRHAPSSGDAAPNPADEPLPPEPLGSLLASCLLYTLWVDALITLLPRRVQQRAYAALGQLDEELADDHFEETPTMLPFGPFLAIGALLVMLFGGTLAAWTRAYFEWAGF